MNWAKEMNDKGIKQTELTLKELQQLHQDGKITDEQFTKIIMDNLGTEKFLRIMQETLEETYGTDFLKKPLPENLHKVFYE